MWRVVVWVGRGGLAVWVGRGGVACVRANARARRLCVPDTLTSWVRSMACGCKSASNGTRAEIEGGETPSGPISGVTGALAEAELCG